MEKSQLYFKFFSALLSLLLISGCTTKPEPPIPEPPKDPILEAEILSMEETIEAYFNAHYSAYSNLEDLDLGTLLDTSISYNQNLVSWTQALIQRRRLLSEHDLCYVAKEIHPFTITYEFEVENPFFDPENDISHITGGGGGVAVYLRITGLEGEVYPPIMALNSQHVLYLRQTDGVWAITMHYFPGAVRTHFSKGMVVPSEEEMLVALKKEFAPIAAPAGTKELVGTPYQPQKASAYARKYTEVKNPEYYDIGDFTGNCANFISQSLSSGFQDRQTFLWFGGAGGGPLRGKLPSTYGSF